MFSVSFYLLVLTPSLRIASFISLSFDTFVSLSVLIPCRVAGTAFSQLVPRAPPLLHPSATWCLALLLLVHANENSGRLGEGP